jgi:glyoxylase-like metal-dependent hydrolase (beta-lactamase superfamily II)
MLQLPIPFPIKTTNVYFVDDSPRTLIDTGIKTDASFEAFRKGMEALGRRFHQIERILITHGHIDHYGQAKKLSSLSGAPIYIHSKEYGKIHSMLDSFGLLESILLRNGVPKGLVVEAIHDMKSAQSLADPLEEAFFLKD